MGVENNKIWSEMRSGFGDAGGTLLHDLTEEPPSVYRGWFEFLVVFINESLESHISTKHRSDIAIIRAKRYNYRSHKMGR